MPEIKDGDIVGFSGSYIHSDFINLLTYGIPRYSLSHVGIVARKNKRTKWLVFESNEDCPWPCAITKQKHDGVQAHSLDLLLREYPGKMWMYSRQVQSPAIRELWFYNHLVNELGTPYDWMGAKRAGGFLHSFFHTLLHKPDTSSLFCSELIAMILYEYGLLETDNVSTWSPNRLMRHLTRKGIYDKAVRLK